MHWWYRQTPPPRSVASLPRNSPRRSVHSDFRPPEKCLVTGLYESPWNKLIPHIRVLICLDLLNPARRGGGGASKRQGDRRFNVFSVGLGNENKASNRELLLFRNHGLPTQPWHRLEEANLSGIFVIHPPTCWRSLPPPCSLFVLISPALPAYFLSVIPFLSLLFSPTFWFVVRRKYILCSNHCFKEQSRCIYNTC